MLQTDESLDLQLDRSQRVLDFVRNLTRHLAPRLVALRLSELSCRIGQILYHSVVCVYKRRDLVLSLVEDVLEVVDVRAVHLLTHLHERGEHRVHLTGTDQERDDEQEKEQVHNDGRVEEGLPAEIVVAVSVRDTHNRDYVTLLVEERGIE